MPNLGLQYLQKFIIYLFRKIYEDIAVDRRNFGRNSITFEMN